MKQLIAVAAILISLNIHAQQYKFNQCDNYHFLLDQGYTVNEAVSGNAVVTVTQDSIKFSSQLVSATDVLAFQINRRENAEDDNGNKLLLMEVKVDNILVSIVITGNRIYSSFEK